MSNKCACCGSNVPEAAYGCFACGAPRDQAPGPMGVCPRCQYRLMQGVQWCAGCNLPADKIAFGAPAAPQHVAPPQQADAAPSYARPAVTYAQASHQAPQQPPPPKPPKPPKPPRPPRVEGATSQTQQYLIIGGVLGGALILAAVVTFMPKGQSALPNPGQTAGAVMQPPLGAVPAPTPPAAPGTPTQAAAEAHLLADPIDGPFFQEFRDLLPADYATMMRDLLAEVPDPARNMASFDRLLGAKLEEFRIANAQAIAGAEDSVLDEMAENMLFAMRAPEYCQAAIDPDSGGLDPGNTVTRRLGVAISASIVRAVASGRKHAIDRPSPTAAEHAAFQSGLQARLYAPQWEAYQTGAMARLPLDEQCTIYVAHWTLIAGYGPALSAIWTADQMKAPSQ